MSAPAERDPRADGATESTSSGGGTPGARAAAAPARADVESLPFDQYQRYRLVSDLLGELRDGDRPLSILDVGGRTALLREFLERDRVTLVDPDPSDEPGLVLGDGCALPFADRAFDVVCAFDTLEHVPPDRREAFVAECRRVARRHVVLAGPYQTERVAAAERELRTFMKEKLAFEHRYLEEHHRYGLPDRSAVEAQLHGLGGEVESLGHANLDRWLVLMCVSMYMDHEPVLRGIAKGFHRFYNRALYASDHAEPVYRHVVVAAFDGAPLPRAAAILDPPVAPAGAVGAFQRLAEELLVFDKTRDVWKEEVARLHGVAAGLETDRDQHQKSLAELRERYAERGGVIATLETDLAGHAESLRSAKAEIAELHAAAEQAAREHEKERAELLLRIDEAVAVVATKDHDLAGHRGRIADLETELEEVRAARVEAEEAHGAALAGLQREIAQWRETTDALRTDLAGHQESLAALDADFTAFRAMHEAFAKHHQELEGRLEAEIAAYKTTVRAQRRDADALRQGLEELRSTYERFVEEHHAVRAALESDLAQHRLVKAEHERVIAEQQAVIESWAGELADRWRNLRRAVRWKIPEYGTGE